MKFKLRQVLEQKHISLLKFCKVTGFCYRTLNQYTLGKTKNMAFDILEKLCYALDCSMDDLIEFEIPKHDEHIRKLYK